MLNTAKASHISGGDVTWQCLGGDTFLITYNIFRDCSGIGAPTSLNVSFQNNCGSTFSQTMTQTSFSEVSQLCPSQINSSTCNGGSLPGMQQYVYQATVVFPPVTTGCGTWTMSWTTCCRNNPTNVTATTSSSTFIGTMYRNARACNNSPQYTAQPIPYVCNNQVVNYNYGVVESDGDSLVFSFDCGFNTAGNPPTNLAYNPGYSCTSPIPGITIDPATGQITFTPTINGEFVVVVKVEEYDPTTGALLSVTYRDIQIVVLTCSNQIPFLAQGIHNFTSSTGGGYVVDSNSVEVCIGDSISFDVMFVDPDNTSPGDSITLFSNIDNVLDTNSLTTIYTTGDTAIMTVGWIAQPGSNPFNSYIVSAVDDACPVTGLYTVQFDITIIEATYAGPDKNVCQGTQSSVVEVDGGSAFTWEVIYPGQTVPVPMTAGSDYTDLTAGQTGQKIEYPIVTTPLIGQHYLIVTSNLSSSCNNVDTMIVNVAPDYTLTMPNDTLICSIDSFPLFANMSPTYPATYSWTPSASLSNDSIANPWSYPTFPTTYKVTVTSAGGCKKNDSVTIDLSPPFPTGIEIDPADTIICLNDATQLLVDFGANLPAQCGPTYGACLGNSSDITLGTGTSTNSTSSYPTPYGGFQRSAKHQFLYTAAELQAQGFMGGRLNSIAFFVQTVGGAGTYSNYSIKMGCTGAVDMSNWQGGLTEVLSPSNHTVTTGWNTHTFTTPYNWDGMSNLVVEVCFSNATSAVNGNSLVRNTFVPFMATRYVTDNGGFACQSNQVTGTSQIRPNARFNVCQGGNPQQFTYSWSPNIAISNTTVPDPIVNPLSPITYSVIVTDVFGGCSDTIDQFIDVTTQFDAGFQVNNPYCISADPDTLQEIVGGGVYTGTGITDQTLGVFDPAIAGIGTHSVTYSIGGNCANDSTINVTVIPLPDASITSIPEVCFDTTQTFAMSSALPSGIWSGPLIVDSVNGIFDPSLGAAGQQYPVTYSLTTPCFNADTQTITLISPYRPRINVPPGICESDTLDLTYFLQSGGATGSGPVIPDWSSLGNGITNSDSGYFDGGLSGPGFHTVILSVTDLYGACEGVDSIEIQVFALPTVQFTNLEEGYCDDITDNTKIFTNVGGGAWSTNPIAPSTGTIDPTGFVPSEEDTGSWLINYSYTDGNGCTNWAEDTLRILYTPEAPEFVDRSYCIGDYMVFEALVSNKDSVFWYDNSTLTSQVHRGTPWPYGRATDNDSLKFWLVEKNNVCISPRTVFEPVINPSPEAYFDMTYMNLEGEEITEYPHFDTDSLNPIEGQSPMFVQYYAGNLETGDSIYFDFFNNPGMMADAGQCGWPARTEYNWTDPTYTYQCEGVYKVMEVHTNEFGCIDTAYGWISVDFTEYVPNVFSPNGDGTNDLFQIEIFGLRDFQGIIYDRWGVKIYEWNDPNGGWDGSYNGSPASEGVYFYTGTGKQANGEPYVVQGNVTLVR